MTDAAPQAHFLEPAHIESLPLLLPLDAAEPKPEPTGEQPDKKNYAQRLSNALAQAIADALRPQFPNITPTATGKGQEARVRVAESGTKRLDVKVTDPSLGLLLSVSIKTLSFRDYERKTDVLKRFTKNVVRNDHEIRGEASVLHQRQPYSVVIGVLFTPIEAALDGSTRTPSSLAHMATTFRKRTGRGRRRVQGLGQRAYIQIGGEDTRLDLCERFFLGVYEWQGPRRGHVRFVDVELAVPAVGLPPATATLSFDQFVASVAAEVTERNSTAPAGWVQDASDDE